jgi:hypothetical protein
MRRSALAAGVLLAAALAARVCAGAGGEAEERPAHPAVTVEVIGLATVEPDTPPEETHRAALLDAQRNALLQAHAALHAETAVEGMRLEQARIRSHAVGYIEQMQVQEAGLVPGSDPPLYRVRARALVWPLRSLAEGVFPPGAGVGLSEPAVALVVRAIPSAGGEEGVRAALGDALKRCGIAVTGEGGQRAALSLEVTVRTGADAGEAWTRVSWDLGFGIPDSAGGTAAVPATGHWLLTGKLATGSVWWERVAVTIAQDALRLWSLPRRTRLEFRGADEDLVRRLEEAFARVPGARAATADEGSVLVVGLSLAGDPLRAVEGLLAQAGLAGRARPVVVSLSSLVFEFAPRAERHSEVGEQSAP